MEWKYKVIDFTEYRGVSGTEKEETILNIQGNIGWELISIVGTRAYFKRSCK